MEWHETMALREMINDMNDERIQHDSKSLMNVDEMRHTFQSLLCMHGIMSYTCLSNIT